MTVVIGVVTVRPVGVVTAAVVTGVVTFTVAATGAGSVGIETLAEEEVTDGVCRVEADCDGDTASVVGAGLVPALEPSVALK